MPNPASDNASHLLRESFLGIPETWWLCDHLALSCYDDVVRNGKTITYLRRLRGPKLALLLISAGSILLLGATLFMTRGWIYTAYYQARVERTVRENVQPIHDQLLSLGFNDLSRLDTDCGYPTYVDRLDDEYDESLTRVLRTRFVCSSGIDRFVKLPESAEAKAAFIRRGSELDKALKDHGWQPDSDSTKSTTTWLELLSTGHEFQPPQGYSRQEGDIFCTVGLWTAYSEPDPPATSIRLYCSKKG